MDPYWNIESVMNPPKPWNVTGKGKGENTGRPVGYEPPLAVGKPANGAPTSKEANPTGNANRVRWSDDQIGKDSAQTTLTDIKNTTGKPSVGPQPPKESCGGSTINRPTNPPLVTLLISTTNRPTARKTPHKHKHKPVEKRRGKKARADPDPDVRTKSEKYETLRKEREAKRLVKEAKRAMRAEKRMVKEQKEPNEGADCEPCRIN